MEISEPKSRVLIVTPQHLLMHTTKSIDFAIVLIGEIFLVLDKDEVLLKSTDAVIQRGTSHAWSNKSDVDCLVAYVLLDAHIES